MGDLTMLRSGRWVLSLCLLFVRSSVLADPPDAFAWPQATDYAGNPDVTDGAFVPGAVRPVADTESVFRFASEDSPFAVQPAGYAGSVADANDVATPAADPLSVTALREQLKRLDAGVDDSGAYGKGMTVVLDDDGKKYIRFLTWSQVWTKFTENNPGTVNDYDELQDDSADIGIRRARFLTYSQLTERYLILVHFGINNQTFTNGGAAGSSGFGPNGVGKKPQIFFHDIYNEYAIVPQSKEQDFSMYVGAGLHYWNGISRKSSSSTMAYMTIDAPIFCWPNIEFSDEFARQLGWYTKGKLHKLDYRVAMNQPFNTDGRGDVNHERAVNIPANTWAYAGYFDWEFWDQESDVLPYKTSSWLGEKKVFNVGAGFYYHPAASGILNDQDELEKQGQLAVGVDAYYDRPVGDCGAAVTLYGVYYIFDYGDNYFRNIGIMNTGRLGDPAFLAANGIEPTISGAGNAQPFMGTGEIFYLEGGYVLPKWILGDNHGRLQPFAAFTHKNMAWLDDPAFDWDMGCNYLIDGHRAKITMQYSIRPQFFARPVGDTVERVQGGSAGELIIQAQVAL